MNQTVTQTLPHQTQPHSRTLQDYFERIATDIDQWHHRNRFYYRDLETLHQFLIPAGRTVLEVGCGTGKLLAALRPEFGVGIDFAPKMIDIAKSRYGDIAPNLHFLHLNGETFTPEDLGRSLAIDYPDALAPQPEDAPINETLNHSHGQSPKSSGQFSGQFDFIVLSGVMGYLGNIQQVLEQLQQFCHPHTRLIFTFHNHGWESILHLAERIGQRCPQPVQNWLSMTDVLNLLTISGYTTVKTGRRFLAPKNLPLVSFLVNRYLAHLPLLNRLCLTQYVVARPVPQTVSEASVTVVIPARNEAGNIQPAIERLPLLGKHTEVIFVEGHSKDDTWAEIQRVIAYYQEHPKPNFSFQAWQQTGKGKADAVRLGFDKANGDILMILDADLTVKPEDLPQFARVMIQGRGEFINGSRLVYPRSEAAMPWLNTLANQFFALMFSFLLGQTLKDTLCGTKVLWRSDYERIVENRSYFGDFDPFGDFDLLFGAAKLNLHIVEVPVRYEPRTYGASNIAHVREGLILLKMCVYAARKIKFL
ncbi:MAG: glycosyltransferase [Pseudanabaena sp. ELA607]